MSYIALCDYIGTDDPVSPAAVDFVAKPAKSCRLCLFKGQRSSVCHLAAEEARRRGIEDCDKGFAYVRKDTDARQLTILED